MAATTDSADARGRLDGQQVNRTSDGAGYRLTARPNTVTLRPDDDRCEPVRYGYAAFERMLQGGEYYQPDPEGDIYALLATITGIGGDS